MRVAIVHDDLVQWGGAERILEGLLEIYPDAPVFTSVYDKSNKQLSSRFGNKKVITSFLQKIPFWRSLYKILLPFYPIAFEQFDFTEFDLVISHTTRFAKSIITKPETKHVSFCHTPPRFLWHFSRIVNYGWGEILLTKLRIFDQISANRVDNFIAGSKNAAKRIEKIYRRKSIVVYPYIDFKRFENIEIFDGGYFVVVGRLNQYKRFDLAIEACKKVGIELKIVDGRYSEGMVCQILAGCRALIIPGIEDFGLVSLEAQALGKTVVAYKEGGSLETVIDGETGIFFEKQDVDSLVYVLANLKIMDKERCRENAKRFSKENFMEHFQQAVDSM